MLPWLSRFQWHAFTLFPHPTKTNHSTLCIGIAGDWTKRLHDEIIAPLIKPAYFYGPFESEFSDVAIDATHCIAVASGIGITPTLNLVHRYADVKRVNVIWTCRDAGLVEYFLHKMDLSAISQYSFLLIFYTGHRELVVPRLLPVNFFILRTRPSLTGTIAGIISLIEKGEDLPEEMYENQRELAEIPFEKRIKIALSRVLSSYTREEFFEYGVEKTEELKLMAARPMTAETNASQDCLATSSHSQRRSGKIIRRRRRTDIAKAQTNTRNVSAKVSADFLIGDISIEGLDATISSLLGGIGEYTFEDIKGLFQQVDTDGSGFIDKTELDSFFDTALSRVEVDTELIDKVELGLSRKPSHASLVCLGLDDSGRSSMAIDAKAHVDQIFGGYFAIEHLLQLSLDPDRPLKDWSIFYCGGSQRIESELRETKEKYGIGDLAVERFDW
mmetsp:Transcript_21234/g.60918  ORF Transcript_21234/g.60918 Transcript_21234/m.60918 type:complete len:444 (-) Transcript_21234:984-2315(-)